MIYLIITTCLHNKFGIKHSIKRKDDYICAITETLLHVPASIIPVIVENNGQRETYLDNFVHNGNKVPVLYTTNNTFGFKSKGINEALDIKHVINTIHIQSNDIIIKLTGRYKVLSSLFFDEVIKNEKIDAFVKFFNVDTLQYDDSNCVLGYYAIRCLYFQLWNHHCINNYDSAEIAFAKYVRMCGATYKCIDRLDMECNFADDNRRLLV
jgi:hypothetical protein